ncbi:ATP phosphoribosyltransferase regulatory subunit [Hippea jasoniae]|uniref:ATP phosphoribosyltransferase regulatory subunit n=1 Tax=Hippea jasoniae TaxID=944479 RepID=UPI000559294E|nr:ATP phosphoribosyltransferase regulatory subunit [Hippea jasoniae]
MNKIPSGSVQFFEPLSSIRRKAENTIIELLAKHGYKEIVTPTFVYEDSISEYLFEPLKKKLFKIVDKTNGQTMILRADITLQLMQAVLFGNFTFPARVCYAQDVYRDIKEHLGEKREFRQVGAELFGIKDLDADIEIIKLSIEALKGVGFDGLVLKIADTDIPENLIKQYNLNAEQSQKVREFINKKDISSILKLDINDGLKETLLKLQKSSGYFKLDSSINNKVFETAKAIADTFEDIKIYCDLFFDEYPLYHRGITFEIFVDNKRVSVGGRYGNITKNLGKYLPATGFAINLDDVCYLLFERGEA